MPIDTKHPDFVKSEPQWSMCSDFDEGSPAVKAKGKLYLPQPEGMDRESYKDFVMRAAYFNGVGRTSTGLVGAMTRVDTDVKLPTPIEHLRLDASGNGMTLQEFIKLVIMRVMVTGRCGILTERSSTGGPARLSLYYEHAIVNWREDDQGNLIMLVLKEMVLVVDPKDPFEAVEEPQYRELFLDAKGSVWVALWKKQPSSSTTSQMKFVRGAAKQLRSSTGDLKEIPFVFCSPIGTQSTPVKAPLQDLCEVNHSHYMVSADLEHGRHLVSLPTPWVTGVDPDDYKTNGLKIGSGTAWIIDNPDAKVGMLEFTGKGLGHLAEAISEKQHQMAILGAKLLQPQRKQVESAELARMANAGDESILVGIAKSVGLAIQQSLQTAVAWQSSTQKVEVHMNTDFIDTRLEPEEIVALTALFQADIISIEELLQQLKTGERLEGDPAAMATQMKNAAELRKREEAAPTTEKSAEGTSNAGRSRKTAETA